MIRKAKAKARDENKVNFTLTLTPTARNLLAEIAKSFDLSLSELMERIARKEIGIDLDRQLLGES